MATGPTPNVAPVSTGAVGAQGATGYTWTSSGASGAAGPRGGTGPAGPMEGSMSRSFPGESPSVVSETKVGEGASLIILAKASIFVQSSITISQEIRAYLDQDDKDTDTFLATMRTSEVYELGAGALPAFGKSIRDSLESRELAVPDDLDRIVREAARSTMKMSAVLMAEIHLDYLREEDFAEAWRAAHVLHVMDT